MKGKGGSVYILANKNNITLYTGVTSDLLSRVDEHRQKVYPKSFTSKYNISKLVYHEGFHSIEEAILREKQIKAGSRKKKIWLIESINPEWNDLFVEIEKMVRLLYLARDCFFLLRRHRNDDKYLFFRHYEEERRSNLYRYAMI